MPRYDDYCTSWSNNLSLQMYHESIFFLFDKYQSNFSSNSNCEKSFLPPKQRKSRMGFPNVYPRIRSKRWTRFQEFQARRGLITGAINEGSGGDALTAENKVSFFLLDERGLDDVLERGGGMYTAPISTPSTPFVPPCDCDKSLRAERILILKLDKRVHVVTTL